MQVLPPDAANALLAQVLAQYKFVRTPILERFSQCSTEIISRPRRHSRNHRPSPESFTSEGFMNLALQFRYCVGAAEMRLAYTGERDWQIRAICSLMQPEQDVSRGLSTEGVVKTNIWPQGLLVILSADAHFGAGMIDQCSFEIPREGGASTSSR